MKENESRPRAKAPKILRLRAVNILLWVRTWAKESSPASSLSLGGRWEIDLYIISSSQTWVLLGIGPRQSAWSPFAALIYVFMFWWCGWTVLAEIKIPRGYGITIPVINIECSAYMARKYDMNKCFQRCRILQFQNHILVVDPKASSLPHMTISALDHGCRCSNIK